MLHEKQSHRRIQSAVQPRTKRPSVAFRNARLLALSVLLAITYLNFVVLPSYDVVVADGHERAENLGLSTKWSKRKISNIGSISAPVSQEDEIFLRTGRAPGRKSGVVVLSDATNRNIKTLKKGAAHRRKKNRLIRGTHLSLAEMNGWPALEELIGNDGKLASHEDISWLLDFAIVGFAKTGTTSMLKHLSEITHMPSSESCGLSDENIVKFVKDMYSDRSKRLEIEEKNGHEFKEALRGLKCPQDISSEVSMHNYAKYFPNTKLIIGVRHPVRWFESLYNFRVSNVPWKKMLHTSKLLRGCTYGSQGVCAQRANFADFLSQLGKTPMSSSRELDLLTMGLSPVEKPIGKVFLYDVAQLSESEDGTIRSTQFRQDLKDFLGLSVEIPPFPVIDTSGRFNFLEPIKKQTEADMIDICDSDHSRIKDVLMEKARTASAWIKDYFLQSNDVTVSNRKHFLELLESWNDDPCLTKQMAR